MAKRERHESCAVSAFRGRQARATFTYTRDFPHQPATKTWRFWRRLSLSGARHREQPRQDPRTTWCTWLRFAHGGASSRCCWRERGASFVARDRRGTMSTCSRRTPAVRLLDKVLDAGMMDREILQESLGISVSELEAFRSG